MRSHHHFRDKPRESQTLRPVMAALDRHYDVQATTTGRLRPTLEPQQGEDVAQLTSRDDNTGPLDVRSWIEIPHDAVGMFNVSSGGVPGMNLHDTHLD